MAICRINGREEDAGTYEHPCSEKYFREICPGKYLCMICGNIQNHAGPCSHCGLPLGSDDETRHE